MSTLAVIKKNQSVHHYDGYNIFLTHFKELTTNLAHFSHLVLKKQILDLVLNWSGHSMNVN